MRDIVPALPRDLRVLLGIMLVWTAFAGAPTARGGPRDATVVRSELLGRSSQGRAIRVIETGDPDERRKLLVVGCVHGDETAGIALAQQLARERSPVNADLWIIDDLNPDGVAAGTRQNGRGVDLNRNFPWRWRPLGPPASLHYAGTRPLSEPESRLVYRLVLRIRPSVSIWFHQALGVVDESGGNVAIERRFAELVGLPLVRLPRYPGSAVSWENSRLPGTTAFVVELHAGAVPAQSVSRFVGAVEAIAARDADAS
jgi:murein peptide amidase A